MSEESPDYRPYKPPKRIVQIEPEGLSGQTDLRQYQKALYDLKEDAVSLDHTRDNDLRKVVWNKIADEASTIDGALKKMKLVHGLSNDPNFLNFQRTIGNYAKIRTDSEIENDKLSNFMALGSTVGVIFVSGLIYIVGKDPILSMAIMPLSLCVGYYLGSFYRDSLKKERDQKFNALITESEKLLEYLKERQ